MQIVKHNLENAAVIIRSTEERTENLCRYAILQNGIKKEQIFYIKNISPFSLALRKGFELALEKNYKYTFFIDADQIILPHILNLILSAAHSYNDKFYFVNFLVYDFLSGTISPNGPHFYQTKYLEDAIKLIPNEDIASRPETYTTKKMAAKGFFNYFIDIPSSFHEFEQYYKHTFRHAFNKYHKMSSRIEFINYFRKNINNKHFEIALKAFEYACKNKTKLKLEYDELDYVFDKFQIEELKPIEDISAVYNKLINNLNYVKNNYIFRGYSYQFGKQKLPYYKKMRNKIINSKYYLRLMSNKFFINE